MKIPLFLPVLLAINFISSHSFAQSNIAEDRIFNSPVQKKPPRNLYIDVRHFGPDKVKYEDFAKNRIKDILVEKKHGVHTIKYWVDEAGGNVYCLLSAPDSLSIRKTHTNVPGLLTEEIYLVKGGKSSPLAAGNKFFLDVHNLGAGKVTANDVAAAHVKDLAVEKKYGVNFVTYWVNEKRGVVVCLSQAPDSTAIINTHKEAHGLLPDSVMSVKQGE